MTDLKHMKETLERFGNDTIVGCRKCGRIQYLKFVNGLKNGWSKCCGYTMPIIFTEAHIEEAVKSLPISVEGCVDGKGDTAQ